MRKLGWPDTFALIAIRSGASYQIFELDNFQEPIFFAHAFFRFSHRKWSRAANLQTKKRYSWKFNFNKPWWNNYEERHIELIAERRWFVVQLQRWQNSGKIKFPSHFLMSLATDLAPRTSILIEGIKKPVRKWYQTRIWFHEKLEAVPKPMS